MTVAELVTSRPWVIPLLASLQVDFFCRTERTVAQACADIDLDAEELFSLIDAQQPSEEVR